jgi:hypothetical protein
MPTANEVFPILYDREWAQYRRFVPWSLVAPFEEQAKKNHGGQTLERLAERGGLSPHELVALITEQPLRTALQLSLEVVFQTIERAIECSGSV